MRFSPRPVGLPPVGHVGARTRLLLAAEILRAYPLLLMAVRRNDLEVMAARARQARRGTRPREGTTDAETAARLGLIVTQVLGVLPTDTRCLITSLVLVRLLTLRGIAATIVLGVATEGGFAAHAWVEHRGVAILPVGDHQRLIEL